MLDCLNCDFIMKLKIIIICVGYLVYVCYGIK